MVDGYEDWSRQDFIDTIKEQEARIFNARREGELAMRERAAKVAENWSDPEWLPAPPHWTKEDMIGCAGSYEGSAKCSAPAGIAKDIRAIELETPEVK